MKIKHSKICANGFYFEAQFVRLHSALLGMETCLIINVKTVSGSQSSLNTVWAYVKSYIQRGWKEVELL